MQPAITSVDGIFETTDLSNIQWEDYTSQTLSSYQLLVINGDGVGSGKAIERGFGPSLYFNKNNQQWEPHPNDDYYVDNTEGWNVVYLRNAQGENSGYYYVCKDEDIIRIPDITAHSTFRVRINEGITTTNFNTYFRVKPLYSSTILIPLAPIGHRKDSSGDNLFSYVTAIKTNAGINIAIRSLRSADAAPDNGTKIAQAKQILQNATDKPIQDLDTRVSILETKVEGLQQSVSDLSSQLSSIQGKLDKILSATSSFFVSR